MLEAENHGANIVKQWNSQLDGNTRYTHRLLDGQIRELHEPFEVLGTKVVYPSAFGIASEDINCRCVIHQRARWALDEKELETLKHRARKHGLQTGDKEYFEQVKVKDFEDFKNKYLIAAKKMAKTVENTGGSSKIVSRIFNTIEDPMREVTGAGLESNPKEVQLMLDNLTAAGAEVEYRTEAMGYMPNVVAGKAGKLVIDREASYSAWLHEYTHFEDDKKEGFIGLRIFMDIERCKQWEIHAYDVEKELAREANRPDIVERLEKLKRKEVAKYETSDND